MSCDHVEINMPDGIIIALEVDAAIITSMRRLGRGTHDKYSGDNLAGPNVTFPTSNKYIMLNG